MTQNKLKESQLKDIFKKFNGKKVLVLGDVMLDAYWWGDVSRISPEAPVPIVAVKRKEFRLGGAANVALNLKELGAQPLLVSVIGDDMEGKDFQGLLNQYDISTEHLILSETRPTTVKTRVIGNKHQLLRVDNEMTDGLRKKDAKDFFYKVKSLIDNVDIVIFEDYDKGVLNKEMIKRIMDISPVPTVVDPKKKNFLSYKGATLIKPNLKELQEGLKIDFPGPLQNGDLVKAASQLFKKLNIGIAFITLSEKGVFIASEEENHLIPAHVRSIYDVSGAGDTVVSVASLCLSLKLPLPLIAEIANLAGGLVCEKVGVVPINKDQFYNECYKVLVKGESKKELK